MKQSSVFLTLAVLLCSTCSVESRQIKLHGDKAAEAGTLRGSNRLTEETSQHKTKVVALQEGSHKTLMHKLLRSAARAKKRALHNDLLKKAGEQSHDFRVSKAHRVQIVQKVDLCNGNRYRWMVETRQACKDSFGDESVWNQNRGDGACTEAWQECNSQFESTCCTQPEGPRNMAAYCAREENAQDRACAVQTRMQGVQGSMTGIRDAVGALNTAPPAAAGPTTTFTVVSGDCRTVDAGRCIVSPNWPEDYEDDGECEIKAPSRGVVHPRVKIVSEEFDTESCCDKLTVGARNGGEMFSGSSLEDGPDGDELEGAPTITWSTDFSASGPGWKVCAEDIIPDPPAAPPAPAPLCLQDRPHGHSPGPSPGPSPHGHHPDQVWVPCPAPAPAPAVPGGISARDLHNGARRRHGAGAPGPAKVGPRKPTVLEMQCHRLTALVQAAAANMDAIRAWSEHDGIVAAPSAAPSRGTSLLAIASQVALASSGAGTSEAKDPDLTFAVRRVLDAGTALTALRNSPVCSAPPGASSEDDDDDDDGDDDDDDSDAEEDAEDQVAVSEPPKVNGDAVGKLLEFEGGMMTAVDAFEEGVHPHGRKWWRYRYEYTLVESLVLAFSVMLLFFIMYLLAGVSFFKKFKFYNIGITSRLYRFAWAYLLFHATALMIMVTLAYMLYMPWGEVNIFDLLAKPFHEWVDGRANVPFLGHSWMLMCLNVQFQLFVCFVLYSFFILCVTYNWARALDDWKSMSVPDSRKKRLGINVHHYKDFTNILTERVELWESFGALLAEKRLRFPPSNAQQVQGFHDFQTHLYLTDCFGKALDHLVEVSLKANLFLAVCSLFIAFLAHHYQVAFMYFLPIFIVVGLMLFGCTYFISGTLRSHNHSISLEFVTIHSYCRAIQLCLYGVFFSFSRLLLSNDIFTDFPKVYLAACVGLAVTMILAWLAAGEIMKATICHIALPHKSAPKRFEVHLAAVTYWHTVATCHECGVRQVPSNAATNREWAGTGAMPSTSPRFKESDPRVPDSSRAPWSFR